MLAGSIDRPARALPERRFEVYVCAMRTRHRCPKCDHREVLHIPEPRDSNTDRMAIGGQLSVWTRATNGALEAYVCMRCGFTELYVRDVRALDLSKLDHARVLKADDAGEPYR